MKTVMALSLVAGTALGTVTYPIVDSAQTTAYGNNNGQDAHYLAHAPSYSDNGDGTINDNVTGLMWTKNPGAKMTYADAVKNASNCKTGGHTDWRLPTIKELYSLINFNGIDPDPNSDQTDNLTPFLDNNIFTFEYGNPATGERIIDSQFATSTIYTSTTMGGNKTMFGVNFADGRIKGYPTKSPRKEKTYFVLYVRGNPEYGINIFKDNNNGTITDKASGLTWMKADAGKGMDWPSALNYAEGMEFAGHFDWRLPTAKELQSLVDYSRSPEHTDSAAIDPLFESTPITNEAGQKDYAQYWTSTTHIGSRGTDRAAYVCFGRGLGKMRDEWMDVHGAGCQRSDSKTGSIEDYPKSHGPQGDVQRLHNFVRLVRGGDIKEVDAPVAKKITRKYRGDGQQPQQGKRGGFMEHSDQNKDGKVSKDEFKGPPAHFDRFDKNKDGYISEDEAPSGPPKGRI